MIRRLRSAALVGAARLANAMPALRRVAVLLLNRAPALKRRLKHATANAMASHASPSGQDDDVLLSPLAKRVHRDLLRERSGVEARGAPPYRKP